MKRRIWNIAALLIFMGGLVLMVLAVTGCASYPSVNIPDNAPVWTSEPTTVRNPFYLAPGTNIKTQAHGSYVRPAGSLVYQSPATKQP